MNTSRDAKKNSPAEDWQPLKAGELCQFAEQHSTAISRRRLVAGAGIGLAATALIGVAGYNLRQVEQPRVALNCKQFLESLDTFLAASVDSQMVDAARTHMSYCPHCKSVLVKHAEKTGKQEALERYL